MYASKCRIYFKFLCLCYGRPVSILFYPSSLPKLETPCMRMFFRTCLEYPFAHINILCVQSQASSCSFGYSHFLDTSSICSLSPNTLASKHCVQSVELVLGNEMVQLSCNQVRRPPALPVMIPFAFCLLNLERCSS